MSVVLLPGPAIFLQVPSPPPELAPASFPEALPPCSQESWERGRNRSGTQWVNTLPGLAGLFPVSSWKTAAAAAAKQPLPRGRGIWSEGGKPISFPSVGRWAWTRRHHSCRALRSEEVLLPTSHAPPSGAAGGRGSEVPGSNMSEGRWGPEEGSLCTLYIGHMFV